MFVAALSYAAMLRLLGLVFFAVGATGTLLPGIAANMGVPTVNAKPIELTIVMTALGLYFLVPWWLPRSLRWPSAKVDVVWLAVVAAGAWIAAGIVVSVLWSLAPGAAVSAIVSNAAAAALVLVFAAVMAWALQARAALEAEEAARRAAESDEPLADPHGIADDSRSILVAHHAVLAVIGIAILMVGAGILRLLQIDPALFSRLGQGGTLLPMQLAAGIGVLTGVSLFLRGAMPNSVARPDRAIHVLAVFGWVALLALPAPVAFALVPAGFPFPGGLSAYAAQVAQNAALLRLLPGTEVALLIGALSLAGLLITSVATVLTSPRRAAEAEARHAAASDEPAPVAKAPPPPPIPSSLKPRSAPVRLALRLIALADWIVLRLLGLGLIGCAYLIWEAIQAERAPAATGLTWGQDPLHALGGYAVIGLILAVPVLLPRSVLVPVSVLKGVIKAALVAGAAIALEPALAALPRLLALLPEAVIVPPELLVQAPLGLEAAAAFSAALALLAGLAGQFQRKHRVDYAGRPVVELSQSELRQLRAARMGVNV